MLSAAAVSCGSGQAIDMGRSTNVGGSGGAQGQSGGVSSAGAGGTFLGSPCGAEPCADHRGDRTFVEDGAPSGAEGLFDGATLHEAGSDALREPAILYPSHETMFPIDVTRIRHDWSAAENDLFELRFVGENTTVTVYTSSLDFTPSAEQWDWIAESNRGSAVELSVAGLSTEQATDAWSSAPITLLFSESAVEGAIYYWSTGTQGIMRATVSDPQPEKFYATPGAADAETCVGCHTLSRDGKRLAVGYDGEKLREVSVPERELIQPTSAVTEPPAPAPGMPKPGMPKPGMDGSRPSAWTTFSPDGRLLLVAADGVLTLIDADTGATVGESDGIVPTLEGKVATHPDWAAVGDRVAITLGSKGGNKEVEGGAIAFLSYESGGWGAPEILVEPGKEGENNFFPVWSPDSRLLAYVHATGKSKDATSAELRLFDFEARKVVSVIRANERVGNRDSVLGLGNTMPTWAPSTQPGIFWLAFSSLRAYSVVRPFAEKEDQIWIAAIDPTKPDPSYAAFWAPFQSTAEGNHRAFWTHAADDARCRCVEACGDLLDNDCDGVADEDDCSQCAAEEICGDGIDNDCNCVIDECNHEVCDDGLDNDGDGNVDLADVSCQPK
jgi:hypothetical protein